MFLPPAALLVAPPPPPVIRARVVADGAADFPPASGEGWRARRNQADEASHQEQGFHFCFPQGKIVTGGEASIACTHHAQKAMCPV
jgi:hypothetical protein